MCICEPTSEVSIKELYSTLQNMVKLLQKIAVIELDNKHELIYFSHQAVCVCTGLFEALKVPNRLKQLPNLVFNYALNLLHLLKNFKGASAMGLETYKGKLEQILRA